jgi:hypothetical protein
MGPLHQTTRSPEFFNPLSIGLIVAGKAVWNFAAKTILPFVSTDSEPILQISDPTTVVPLKPPFPDQHRPPDNFFRFWEGSSSDESQKLFLGTCPSEKNELAPKRVSICLRMQPLFPSNGF